MNYFIGVDLGENSIRAGITDENGSLVCKESIRTRPERKANEIIRDTAYLVQNVVKASKLPLDRIPAVGIATSGFSDNETGILTGTVNLPFHNINIRNEIRKIIPLPVYLENSANCAALAESITGISRQVRNSAVVMIGNEIRCGIIIDRTIYSGFNHTAGALGHQIVVLGGEPCSCGRRGCFQSYASVPALLKAIDETVRRSPDSKFARSFQDRQEKEKIKYFLDAAKNKEETAGKIMDDFTTILSEGLLNLIHLIAPEVLVISGDLMMQDSNQILFSALVEQIEKSGTGIPGMKKTRICPSAFGSDAEMTGAALMAKESFFNKMKGV